MKPGIDLSTFANSCPMALDAVVTGTAVAIAGYFIAGASFVGGIWITHWLRGENNAWTRRWFFSLLGWALCWSAPAIVVGGTQFVAKSCFEPPMYLMLGVGTLLVGIRLIREGREPPSRPAQN
jgi:hypothetical protein